FVIEASLLYAATADVPGAIIIATYYPGLIADDPVDIQKNIHRIIPWIFQRIQALHYVKS
ncbi:34559_t:CDS:1, partial [Gigaspora margarita]